MALHRLHNPGAPLTLNLDGLEVTAFSISGVSTYVLVPAFDACFDLGHCPVEATKLRHVFLSHVHQDHSMGAWRHRSIRAMYSMPTPKVYVPTESAAHLDALFRAWETLEGKAPSDHGEAIVPLAIGAEVTLSRKRRVVAFDVAHRIASRGFTVFEQERRLLPAWQGAAPVEIGEARRRGEAVDEGYEVQRFTYVGDSTVATLRKHPEVGQSRVLFLEATHVGDTPRATSQKYGHTHLDELVELWRERPETFASAHIVVKHFSTRYTAREIRLAHDALPEELRSRVTFLIP